MSETMVTDVKARFSNGALRPLEPLDIEEGAEVTLRIVEVDPEKPTASTRAKTEEEREPGSGTHPVIAMIDRLREKYPNLADDDNLPPDLSKNIDHYLYGAPKESDL